jgi:hypothetical protein
MFTKHAFDRLRRIARDARLPVSAIPSRNRPVAVWRREPVSGRLELQWQPAPRARAGADLPSRRDPLIQPTRKAVA